MRERVVRSQHLHLISQPKRSTKGCCSSPPWQTAAQLMKRRDAAIHAQARHPRAAPAFPPHDMRCMTWTTSLQQTTTISSPIRVLLFAPRRFAGCAWDGKVHSLKFWHPCPYSPYKGSLSEAMCAPAGAWSALRCAQTGLRCLCMMKAAAGWECSTCYQQAVI